MKRALTAVLMLTLALAAVAGAWADEPGVTGDEIRIGVCTSFEGQNKAVSEQQTAGAEAYVDYVNKELKGVNGRRVKLIYQNDGFDPERAADCFNTLTSSGVFAQAFVSGAPTAAKYIILAESNKVPLVGINSGAPFLFRPYRRYTFPTRSSFADEAGELVGHLKEMGVTKVGMIFQSDAFGANCLQGLSAALQKDGLQLTGAAGFERNSVDVSQAVEDVRAGNPEVVVMAGNSEPQSAVLKLAKQLGWKPQFVIMVGRDYLGNLADDASEGVILSQPFPRVTETSLPSVALYNKAMAKYQAEAARGLTSLDGFMQAMVLVEGLKRAGKSLTREGFVDAMEGIHDWNAGLGPYYKIDYSKTSHDVVDHYRYVQFQGGKIVPVEDWAKLKK